MSEVSPLSKPLLRELYAIEAELETAARIDGALVNSSHRVLDLLAANPAPIDGFEEPNGDE